MIRGLLLAAVSLVLLLAPEASWAEKTCAARDESCQAEKPKKSKTRGKKRRKKSPPARPKPVAPEPAAPEAPAPEAAPEAPAASEAQPVPPAEGVTEDGRRLSAVTPGTRSRWSNAGAMTPVASEVPITAPLPQRAIPLEPGAPTPGQRLVENDEQITAHFSLGGEHFEVVRQEAYTQNLIRGRGTVAYERIAGSDFGAQADLEYRGTVTGSRRTDYRVNAAYVTWGMTDFRRSDGPDFGVAIGRVAVREAGHATADGAAVRVRIVPELSLGAFGGFAGNPYGYNWLLGKTEVFSTDYINGGIFTGVRLGSFFADVAGVVSYANITRGINGVLLQPGLDRVNAFLDAGYAVSPELDLFFTGWFDFVPDNVPLQNVELMGIWTPSRELNVRLSAGRFSTVFYDLSTVASFRTEQPAVDEKAQNRPIVDPLGNPIVVALAQQQIATYNHVELRGGYRFGALEPYASADVLIRDPGQSANNLDFAALRLQPAVGLLYRDPEVIDARAQALFIIDDQTERRAVLSIGVGREFEGFFAGADARAFVGGTGALDGGFELGYVLPRVLMPGRLMFRVMLRYIREDVALLRPPDACVANEAAPNCNLVGDLDVNGDGRPDNLPVAVPLQESFFGFAGIDWRL